MDKKGQMELRLVMLVIAVVILFIVIVVISGQYGKFGTGVNQSESSICSMNGGTCVDNADMCTGDKMEAVSASKYSDCTATNKAFCCKPQ